MLLVLPDKVLATRTLNNDGMELMLNTEYTTPKVILGATALTPHEKVAFNIIYNFCQYTTPYLFVYNDKARITMFSPARGLKTFSKKLAEIVGMHRQTFLKTLAKFERTNVLEHMGEDVWIVNPVTIKMVKKLKPMWFYKYMEEPANKLKGNETIAQVLHVLKKEKGVEVSMDITATPFKDVPSKIELDVITSDEISFKETKNDCHIVSTTNYLSRMLISDEDSIELPGKPSRKKNAYGCSTPLARRYGVWEEQKQRLLDKPLECSSQINIRVPFNRMYTIVSEGNSTSSNWHEICNNNVCLYNIRYVINTIKDSIYSKYLIIKDYNLLIGESPFSSPSRKIETQPPSPPSLNLADFEASANKKAKDSAKRKDKMLAKKAIRASYNEKPKKFPYNIIKLLEDQHDKTLFSQPHYTKSASVSMLNSFAEKLTAKFNLKDFQIEEFLKWTIEEFDDIQQNFEWKEWNLNKIFFGLGRNRLLLDIFISQRKELFKLKPETHETEQDKAKYSEKGFYEW